MSEHGIHDLSALDIHEIGACGGDWAGCAYCDEDPARYIKDQTREMVAKQ